MPVNRTLMGLVAAAAVAAGGYYAYDTYFAAPQEGAPAARSAGGGGMMGGRGRGSQPVIVTPVREEVFADRLEAIGTLQANESIVVTAKVQGVIESINFEDGEYVEKGATLVVFDDEELRARLQVELANLDEQRKQFERIAGLAKSNAASQARFDEQQAAVKKAEANVAAARARLQDFTIVAPFPGQLGNRRISLGALVSPGTTITTLDDVSEMKLDFSVPETFIATLRPGLAIEATTSAYPSELFRGEVRTIDSRVDPTTRAVSIRAIIPNPDRRLLPGMLMVVDLINNRRRSLMIPEAALTPRNDQQFVFVVDENRIAHEVPVTIGRRKVGSVEILEGLEAGDLVITEGTTSLRDGGSVNILNSDILGGQPSANSADGSTG